MREWVEFSTWKETQIFDKTSHRTPTTKSNDGIYIKMRRDDKFEYILFCSRLCLNSKWENEREERNSGIISFRSSASRPNTWNWNERHTKLFPWEPVQPTDMPHSMMWKGKMKIPAPCLSNISRLIFYVWKVTVVTSGKGKGSGCETFESSHTCVMLVQSCETVERDLKDIFSMKHKKNYSPKSDDDDDMWGGCSLSRLMSASWWWYFVFHFFTTRNSPRVIEKKRNNNF